MGAVSTRTVPCQFGACNTIPVLDWQAVDASDLEVAKHIRLRLEFPDRKKIEIEGWRVTEHELVNVLTVNDRTWDFHAQIENDSVSFCLGECRFHND